MITKNGSVIYSNLSEEDMEVGRSVAGEAMDSAKTLTASRHEVSVTTVPLTALPSAFH